MRDRQDRGAVGSLVLLLVLGAIGAFGYDFFQYSMRLKQLEQGLTTEGRKVRSHRDTRKLGTGVNTYLQDETGVDVLPDDVTVSIKVLEDADIPRLPPAERGALVDGVSSSLARGAGSENKFFVTIAVRGKVETLFRLRSFAINLHLAAGDGMHSN